jgi:hypothetical protein
MKKGAGALTPFNHLQLCAAIILALQSHVLCYDEQLLLRCGQTLLAWVAR